MITITESKQTDVNIINWMKDFCEDVKLRPVHRLALVGKYTSKKKPQLTTIIPNMSGIYPDNTYTDIAIADAAYYGVIACNMKYGLKYQWYYSELQYAEWIRVA